MAPSSVYWTLIRWPHIEKKKYNTANLHPAVTMNLVNFAGAQEPNPPRVLRRCDLFGTGKLFGSLPFLTSIWT